MNPAADSFKLSIFKIPYLGVADNSGKFLSNQWQASEMLLFGSSVTTHSCHCWIGQQRRPPSQSSCAVMCSLIGGHTDTGLTEGWPWHPHGSPWPGRGSKNPQPPKFWKVPLLPAHYPTGFLRLIARAFQDQCNYREVMYLPVFKTNALGKTAWKARILSLVRWCSQAYLSLTMPMEIF